MYKFIISSILVVMSINVAYAQKVGYKLNFESELEIRHYLANNISLLDPLEGEYDVENTAEYITPYVHQYYPKSYFKIYIVCNNNSFKIYTYDYEEGFGESTLEVSSIGETNAYRMYYYSSPTRIFLQNNNHFIATYDLDNYSAKKFTGNNRLSKLVKVRMVDDCIKVYPTASMYADSGR